MGCNNHMGLSYFSTNNKKKDENDSDTTDAEAPVKKSTKKLTS